MISPGRNLRAARRGSVTGVLLKQTRARGLSGSASGLGGSVTSNSRSGSFQANNEEGSGWEVMEDFLRSIQNISSEMDPELLANKIIEETCTLLKADRSTLFFVDAEAGELILVVAKGVDYIHIPIGQGIAGTVAVTGFTENIPDAYADSRFDSSFDGESGFKTTSILACPVREPNGDLVAVLQCINKSDGGMFTKTDQLLLEHIATHVGVALRNVKLYESERASNHKLSALHEVIRMLHRGSDGGGNSTTSLIFTFSNRSHDLVGADRATLYLVDRPSQQLVVMQGDVDFRFPMDKGIVGACVTTESSVNIPDAYKDERFSQEMDKKTGYITKTILCMPIFAPTSSLPESHRGESENQLIGVLQLINKDDDEEFDTEDIQLMETLLMVAGPILGNSKFFSQPPRAIKGDDVAVNTMSPNHGRASPSHHHKTSMISFEEEEEEDE